MQAIIFRHQLFKISEPFITQQAGALNTFEPVYLGRKRFGNPPTDAKTLALEDLPGQSGILSKVWQVATRDPRPYLSLLANHRPSLIHAHFGVEGVYALPLARKLDIPLITTFHGFDATTSKLALLKSGSPAWFNYAVFQRQLIKGGDLFICVSDYIRQRVIALGFPESRTHVHYIGIDTQAIVPRQVTEERPMVLHVARLVEKKGTAYLIRAFAAIAAAYPALELVIIGDGPLKPNLELLAKSLDLGKRIRFLGSRPHQDVMAAMRTAAILAVPSVTAATGDTEGLPIVVLEAAALGVPVVGTLHSGIQEAIDDGKTGFLVPERNVQMLSERLMDLLADHNLRVDMGNDARSFVAPHFDIHKQTAKIETLYTSVLR